MYVHAGRRLSYSLYNVRCYLKMQRSTQFWCVILFVELFYISSVTLRTVKVGCGERKRNSEINAFKDVSVFTQ